jgi:glyoxylate/hydroxypyruvate reductase A
MPKNHILPLVTSVDLQEARSWVSELNHSLQDVKVHLFEEHSVDFWQNAEVAIVADPEPSKLLAMPQLRWVQSLWAGVEKLVQELPVNIPVARMEDPELASDMAEAVLAAILFLHRKFHIYAVQQRQTLWKQHPLRPARDTCVGVLGLGQLGVVASERLRGNGFHVLGWSRSNKEVKGIEVYSGDSGLQKVLQSADILVLLLPLTHNTKYLLNQETLKMMKPGASLVNFARGGIIDTQALASSLESGALEHAVLDVFEQEPLPKAHPLWQHSQVTVLPHISAPTNMKTASKIVARNLDRWFKDRKLPNLVDRTKGY